MNVKIFALLFLLFWTGPVLFSQETPMTAAEIAVFKAKVKEKTKTISTIKTGFKQYKHLDFLSKEIVTSGEMVLKAPDKLLWKYTEPYSYSILFKNKKVHINDQGKKTSMDAGSNTIFGKINSLIVSSVSGNIFENDEFVIRYYKTDKFRIAKLTPREADLKKLIREVEMYFPVGDDTVSEVKLIESSNDYTRIVFKDKKLNIPVDEKTFNN